MLGGGVVAKVVDFEAYIYQITGIKPPDEIKKEGAGLEAKATVNIPLEEMTIEQMILDYNFILNGYKNYILALEQEDREKLIIFKIFGCNSEIEAIENVKILTIGLSILGKRIIKAGYKFTRIEAIKGICMDKDKIVL